MVTVMLQAASEPLEDKIKQLLGSTKDITDLEPFQKDALNKLLEKVIAEDDVALEDAVGNLLGQYQIKDKFTIKRQLTRNFTNIQYVLCRLKNQDFGADELKSSSDIAIASTLSVSKLTVGLNRISKTKLFEICPGIFDRIPVDLQPHAINYRHLEALVRDIVNDYYVQCCGGTYTELNDPVGESRSIHGLWYRILHAVLDHLHAEDPQSAAAAAGNKRLQVCYEKQFFHGKSVERLGFAFFAKASGQTGYHTLACALEATKRGKSAACDERSSDSYDTNTDDEEEPPAAVDMDQQAREMHLSTAAFQWELPGAAIKQAAQRAEEVLLGLLESRRAELLNPFSAASHKSMFATCLGADHERVFLLRLDAGLAPRSSVEWSISHPCYLPGRMDNWREESGGGGVSATTLLLAVLCCPPECLRTVCAPLDALVRVTGEEFRRDGSTGQWTSNATTTSDCAAVCWRGEKLLGRGTYGAAFIDDIGQVIKVLNDPGSSTLTKVPDRKPPPAIREEQQEEEEEGDYLMLIHMLAELVARAHGLRRSNEYNSGSDEPRDEDSDRAVSRVKQLRQARLELLHRELARRLDVIGDLFEEVVWTVAEEEEEETIETGYVSEV